MRKEQHLTAQEAADELGISLTTLYAYVSRGLVRSEPMDNRKRTKRYNTEDIKRLKQRKEQRRNPAKVVEGALHWGSPILESTLTLITDNKLFYRGYEAVALAQKHTIEQIAVLMWTGELPGGQPRLFTDRRGRLPLSCETVRRQLTDLPPIEAFQILLPLAAIDDLAAYDLRPNPVRHTGAHILRLLTVIASGATSAEAGIAQTLQQSWIPDVPQAADLINAALILCADHELNVSSFTARCVASAGSTPYQVVIGGLAALQGVRHGRVTERVQAFFREVGWPTQVRSVIAARLKRGDLMPGFGHPLYPEGDPRARLLLALTTAVDPKNPVVKLAQAIIQEVYSVTHEHPNVDFGLVTLAQALKLPEGSPIALFAMGRAIGWIGHALEAYKVGRIIRPRARYVGEPPRHLP